jgi:exopolysaccharide production protein ExoZ
LLLVIFADALNSLLGKPCYIVRQQVEIADVWGELRMSGEKREPIYVLDIVRFAAALIVMIYHFGFKAFATPGNILLARSELAPSIPQWWAVSWWGWIGVQIFFVISGLVIAYSVEGSTPWVFAKKRALRLLPTVWICALLALPVALVLFGTAAVPALLQFAKTITFIPFPPWLIGQFWTLPIEVCFYAVVWLLIAARRHHLETLAWYLALSSAAYFVAVDLLGIHDPNGRISALLLLQHGGYFALGIMLAQADRSGYRPRHLVLALLSVVLAAVQIRDAATGEHLAGGLERDWAVPFAIWIAFIGVIAAGFRWKHAAGARLRKHQGTLRTMGLLTFPLYLIHIHTGGPILIGLRRIGAPDWSAVLAAIVAAMVAAFVVVRWIEPPLHAKLAMLVALKKASPVRVTI